MNIKRFFSIIMVDLILIVGSIFAIPFQSIYAAPTEAPLGRYYVTVKPDSYYKFRGDTVIFAGSHFYPNETVVIAKDGIRIGTIKADAAGTFLTPSYQVSSTDEKSSYRFFGMTSFLYQTVDITVSGGGAWLTLSNYYAPAGAPVTIYGHNYSKNKNVKVWFDGIYEGIAPTNARGDFMMMVRVPNVGGDKVIVEAIGTKSGMKSTQTFSQAVY